MGRNSSSPIFKNGRTGTSVLLQAVLGVGTSAVCTAGQMDTPGKLLQLNGKMVMVKWVATNKYNNSRCSFVGYYF